jgi:hypothetical protein
MIGNFDVRVSAAASEFRERWNRVLLPERRRSHEFRECRNRAPRSAGVDREHAFPFAINDERLGISAMRERNSKDIAQCWRPCQWTGLVGCPAWRR